MSLPAMSVPGRIVAKENESMRLPIENILRPKSVAVLGVSERPEAIGTRVLNNLRKMGFAGPLYAVNPRYETIGDWKCYPSLSALPKPVDAAFLAVPSAGGPDLVEEAGKCGIRALFINANGYADGDADGVALQRRVEATAAKYGIAICGPNNLGMMNVHDRVAMWSPRYMKVPERGSLGVISQSGSIALILSEDERDLGFAYLITTGNEAVLNVADYLAELAVDDRVKVILLFLETIRDPQAFQAAALKAAEQGKRVIALKLGSSAEGRALVQAHTGSLAGEDRLYDAYFKAINILRVRDLDEMLETAVLLSKDTAALPVGGNVMVTLSGGEAALIADLGSDLGLKFPKLSPETLAALRPAFPSYSSIGNPLDAWGLGFAADRFGIVLQALLADPNINLIGFSVDAPGRGGGDVPYACIMAEACVEAKTSKRLVLFNNTSGSGVNAEVRAILDCGNIPYLSGLRPALAAIANLNALKPAAPEIKSQLAATAVPLPGRQREQFALLNKLGIGMVRAQTVLNAAAAVAAADKFGYPVAMKAVAEHIPHKSDLGLVRLNLVSAWQVEDAFANLSKRYSEYARPGSAGEIVLQAMAPSGVELIVGIRNERHFGSFVIVGPGGVLVELADQASVRLGPVDEREARVMLFETAAGKLLQGARGAPACDIDAAAAAIAAFSRFGAAQAARLSALEINPLIASPHGAWGVDLLLDFRSDIESER
jgi:acetate---CoA ligase (ADP-forming)